MSTFDQEEKEILQAFELGELKSVPNREASLKHHKSHAAVTFRKDKRFKSAYQNEILKHYKNAQWSRAFLIKRWCQVSYTSILRGALLRKYLTWDCG